MELRVLGTVEIATGDGRVELGTGRELAIVTALGLAGGRPVSGDLLLDQVWDGISVGKGTLQSTISRARRRLAANGDTHRWITERLYAYRLDIRPENVDWIRFQQLTGEASALVRAGEEERALTLLHDALGLWRGDPLTGVRGAWAEGWRIAMRKARTSAMAQWTETSLHTHPTEDISAAVSGFVADSPFDERLTCCLMRALHAAGRTPDALAAYRRFENRLVRRYGTDPGAQAKALYGSLIKGGTAQAGIETAAPEVLPPQRDNMQRDIIDFTDRRHEIDQITADVPGRHGVHVVSGKAGVGKSTLAIHVAHRLRPRFPDARLYLDLRGNQDEPQLEPLEALQELLVMDGVPQTALPPTLEQRAALWRDRVSDKRALLVLDHAGTPEQVRPLLPGSPDCMVLVTSRRRLSGLDGARHVQLLPPSPSDAEKLFAAVSGRDSTHGGAELRAVVELCDRLPLALRLLGTWLRKHPAWTLPDLRDRLAETGDLIDGIPEVGLKLVAVLTLAVKDLSAGARALFLRGGTHPDGRFTLNAAAALAGLDVRDCEPLLEELMDQHLIEEIRPYRYRLDGLVAAFARGTARREIPAGELRAAHHRLMEYYLRVCDAADRTLDPGRVRMPLELVHDFHPPGLAGPDEAAAWFAAEHSTIIGVIAWALDRDHLAGHGARLMHGMAAYTRSYGPWETALRLHVRAVRTWRLRGDRTALAYALIDHARCLTQLGRTDEALESAREAGTLWNGLGDLNGQAVATHQIGRAYAMADRHNDARPYLLKALDLYRGGAVSANFADCLNNCANCDWELGDLQGAARKFTEALELYRACNDLGGMASIHLNHAAVYNALGRHREALQLLDDALHLSRRLRDRRMEGLILANMGRVRRYKGAHRQALRHYAQAVRIQREIGNRQDEIRALIGTGSVYQAMGATQKAIDYFEGARNLVGAFARPDTETMVLTHLGEAHADLSDDERAERCFSDALAVAVRAGLPVNELKVLAALGSFHLTRGRVETALTVLRKAESLGAGIEAPKENARVRLLLDSIEMSHGEAI